MLNGSRAGNRSTVYAPLLAAKPVKQDLMLSALIDVEEDNSSLAHGAV